MSRSEDDRLVEQSRARMRLAPVRREAATTAVVVVAFALSIAAIRDSAPDPAGHSVLTAVLLVLCYAAVARVQFEVGAGAAVLTQLVFVPMLFLASPALVPLLVALGYALSALPRHLRGDWHPARLGLHIVSSCYAIGPVVVLALAGHPDPTLAPRTLAIVALGLVAQFAIDVGTWAALGHSPGGQARALAVAWRVDLALTPLALALVAAGGGHRYAFLLGLPLVALLAEFARHRSASVGQAEQLSEAYLGTALLLGDVVEADDSYTGRHSRDVVSLVLDVSDRMGLDDDARHTAQLAALLHDVGKVAIPNGIIRKPGALTPEERKVIETHTVEGERMLKQVGGLLGEIGTLVRSCHERWDGGGYPDGLAGAEIPLVARIVCACDAFSAMTTDRSYRNAMTYEAAVAELHRCAGTHFDPAVVEALAAVAGGYAPGRLDQAA
ncbi:MAG TPA: HD-GYP domain-containing protein [Gaiellales bacterium]|nr:HD-GYP domain-containing protein [Gaiellales bacterium]